MDHPFIDDAGELTDNELHEKMQKLTQLLYSETYWGHKNVTDSIRAALDVYQIEMDERLFIRMHDMELAKNPDGIIEIGKIEGEVLDYDEVEKKNAEVKVKRHKDL